MRTVITTSFAWCELKHRQKIVTPVFSDHRGFEKRRRQGAPIRNMAGGEDFNEVVFDNVLVPKDRIVGEPGNGWQQVTSELAYERSGPERFVVFSGIRRVGAYLRRAPTPHRRRHRPNASHFMTLRRMSLSVAGMLESGKDVSVEAALVKELGNNFEKLLPEIARLVVPDLSAVAPDKQRLFRETFEETLMLSPSFTLRGGTREIMRGVIARGLGFAIGGVMDTSQLIIDTAEKIFPITATRRCWTQRSKGRFHRPFGSKLWTTGSTSWAVRTAVPKHRDLFAFLKVCGRYAVPLPMAEILLSNQWLGGNAPVQGFATIGQQTEDGVVQAAWGRQAQRCLASHQMGWTLASIRARR